MALRAHALALALLAVAGPVAVAHKTSAPRPCVVPNVKGMTLAKAKTRLTGAHCATGKITGPRTAYVSNEIPKAGKHEKNRSKVALTFKRNPVAPKTGSSGSGAGASGAGSTGSSGSSGGDSGGSSGGASGGSSAPPTSTQDPIGISGNWHLILDSEFTGNALPQQWAKGWGGGTGLTDPVNGNEPDCYSPNNVTFPNDGSVHLNITVASGCSHGPYDAALINTNPKWSTKGGFQYTYGVLEARVYLPGIGGQIADWPGVWTNGQDWPSTGEDDLMEGIGGGAWASWHGPSPSNPNAQVFANFSQYLGPGWHTLASDWEPGSVTFYWDGAKVWSTTVSPTSAPQYLIIQNSMNSKYPAVNEPDSMQVKWVRVFQ